LFTKFLVVLKGSSKKKEVEVVRVKVHTLSWIFN